MTIDEMLNTPAVKARIQILVAQAVKSERARMRGLIKAQVNHVSGMTRSPERAQLLGFLRKLHTAINTD